MGASPYDRVMRSIAIVVALSACAHNVRQDKATGADGNIKGAVPIALENNEGEAKGIVTYPGGDRVDWKSIAIPEGKKGTLALKLTYTTPRPGLHVAFDVFDQWHAPVAKAVYSHSTHARETTISLAKGTYYVRVYAPKRGDAGRYKLVADFTEQITDNGPDWTKVQIPDPPKLADATPQDGANGAGPDAVCDPFDTKNKACLNHCAWDAQPNWPGCAKECPDLNIPDNAKFPACARQMKCGAVKDPRIDACNVVAPAAPIPPVTARVIKKSMEGGVLHVWLGVGTSNGVDKNWTVGHVMNSATGKFLPGGTATIVKINKTTTELTVTQSIDGMTQNDTIQVGPQ